MYFMCCLCVINGWTDGLLRFVEDFVAQQDFAQEAVQQNPQQIEVMEFGE